MLCQYTKCHLFQTHYCQYTGNISQKNSRNYEKFALEIIENLKKNFSGYFSYLSQTYAHIQGVV